MTFLFLIPLLIYAGLMAWLGSGFLRTANFDAGKAVSIPVTIICCARNEEEHIAAFIRSVLAQEYDLSKVQLILVDDASADRTMVIAEQILAGTGLTYRLIRNKTRKGKKQSLTDAMALAENELVITRDADTFSATGQWLQTLTAFRQQKGADLIIAPVAIHPAPGLLWALEAVENNVLAVFSCGSAFYHKPFLCSGANLAFTKKIFERVKGYSSHLHLPSGDDVFFLEDVKKLGDARILYLKSPDAIVKTYAAPSLKALISQKVRWSAKFRTNPNPLNRALAITGFLVNLCFITCLFLLPDPRFRAASITFLCFKLLIDFLLLFLASAFIKTRRLGWYTLPVAFLYPFYAVVVGLGAMTLKPGWKT